MSELKRFLDFSKPFIDATRNIFETMIFTKIETQKPSIKDTSISKGDVSAVLGLSGDYEKDGKKIGYRAMLVISFPYSTYCKISSAMLMEEHSEYNEEISDVAGEICNMVMGNAKRDLSVQGYSTNMAIPSIVEGSNHTIRYPSDTTVVLIPIKCDHGSFYMEVCYNDFTSANEVKSIDVEIKK
jgi:chemotaxis protein CheX